MVIGSQIKLNLVPSGVMPVVYINQGDMGYDKEFLVYNGDSPYNVPSGVSATVRGTKADGYGVTEAATVTTGSNLVTVTITEQMVAAEGENLYELVFVDTDGLRVASINMIWAVKKDALGDSVISDSDLDYATTVMNTLQSVQAFKNQLDTNTDGLATETAARIASDTALQNKIDAEKTDRITADNGLQTDINAEAAARLAQDNNLQAQINQLVAPSGAAPSAAEVQNARIGADGVTYSTLGDAIRTQVTDVNNAITEIVQHTGEEGTYTIDLSKYDTALGTFDASGKLVSASTRIVTQSFIDISEFENIKVTRTNGYRYNIAFYADADENTWISSANTQWVLDDHAMVRVGKYARITAYDPNGGTVAPSDFSAFIVTGLNYRTAEKELKQLIDETAEQDTVFVNLTASLERGALVNGDPASASSYVRTVNFIPVYDYASVTLYGEEQAERIKVILYDSTQAYLRDATAQNGFPYSVDLSNVAYIKITLGMAGSPDSYSADVGFLVACFTKLSEFNKTGKNEISISNLFAMYSMTRGILASASSRISTQQFINISDYDVITVNPLNGYYFGIAFYSQANENAYLYMHPWSNTEMAFDTSNANFCRITLRRSDNAGMQTSEGSNVNLFGYPQKSSYALGAVPSIPSKLNYDGERISLKPTYNYYNILKNLNQIYDTAYPFTESMQQGAAVYNDHVFMFRHHAKCTVLNLNDYSVDEFEITDIPSNSHCNSANFSTAYPVGNAVYPYLYVGRCTYTSDAQEGETVADLEECYVFNVTTTSASLVQTIKYMNDNGDYSYSTWDWMVDNDRNRLVCIGFAEAYGAARRSYIFKEFALPDPTSASIVTLHDSDVIEQWQVEDKMLQAFQGGTIYGKYVFAPVSNETTESVFVYDKYAHRQIATIPFVKAVTQELQSASVYNGKLYVIAAEGRIDEIIF